MQRVVTTEKPKQPFGGTRPMRASWIFNQSVTEDGPTVFAHACRLGVEGTVSKKVDGTYRSGPCPAWIKVRNPASIAVQSAFFGIGAPRRRR